MSRADARLLLDTLRLGAPAPAGAARWQAAPAALGALAEQQGASLWLLQRLGALELLPALAPPFAAALRAAAARHAALNVMVDDETLRIATLLDELAVPFVLLKGSARRALASRVPYADARLTRDVDLLVPEAHAAAVWERLTTDGYTRASTWEPDGSHYHLPALLSPGKVGVELHVSSERDLPPAKAWERFSGGAHAAEWRGRAVRVPSDTELLAEAVRHAMLEDAAGYRLRYFLDAAAILQSGRADEPEVSRRIDAGSLGDTGRARRWLNTARSLATRVAATGEDAFALEPVLGWQLVMTAKLGGAPRIRETTMDAATRIEAGLPMWRAADGSGGRLRRLLEQAARLGYLSWR